MTVSNALLYCIQQQNYIHIVPHKILVRISWKPQSIKKKIKAIGLLGGIVFFSLVFIVLLLLFFSLFFFSQTIHSCFQTLVSIFQGEQLESHLSSLTSDFPLEEKEAQRCQVTSKVTQLLHIRRGISVWYSILSPMLSFYHDRGREPWRVTRKLLKNWRSLGN